MQFIRTDYPDPNHPACESCQCCQLIFDEVSWYKGIGLCSHPSLAEPKYVCEVSIVNKLGDEPVAWLSKWEYIPCPKKEDS